MNDVPAATFLNFLSGLAAQALMQFGQIPNPLDGERTLNLPYARYTVELIDILAIKTRGNLTPEEDAYLVGLVADMHQRLERAQTGGSDPVSGGPAPVAT